MSGHYLRDCHSCGGGGCKGCRRTGTEVALCITPQEGFTVRGGEEGFERDRESCPCYEGIKINDGVDQCGHPENRALDNWCEPASCPLLRRPSPFPTPPDGAKGER